MSHKNIPSITKLQIIQTAQGMLPQNPLEGSSKGEDRTSSEPKKEAGSKKQQPQIWLQRCVSIPLVLLVWHIMAITLLPAVLLLGSFDLLRKKNFAAMRTWLFIFYYLSCEYLGIVVSAGLWVYWKLHPKLSHNDFLGLNFKLQCFWGDMLLKGSEVLFSMHFQREGEECTQKGPYFLFLRHASMADTVLTSSFISKPFGIRFRYVLKHELLWDPCLNIVGLRLPNAFIKKNHGHSSNEIARIRSLAQHMGEQDGVLIYPEGTRFTDQKRKRIIQRLKDKEELTLLRWAESYQKVLPPRFGGALALIDENPRVDVVFCSHSGFDEVPTFYDLWNGKLIGRTIKIKFWRVQASDIPSDEKDRQEWLLQEWKKVDKWITQ